MNGDLSGLRNALSSPEDVCARLNLTMAKKRTARGVMVRCPDPRHPDRTPSCHVRVGPDGTLQWRCHACGAKGDVFTLVAVVRGLDVDREFAAVVRAAEDLAGGAAPMPPAKRLPPEPRRLSPIEFSAIAAVLVRMGNLGERTSSDVARYLDDRGLLEPAARDGWFALPLPVYQDEWCRMLVDFTDAEHPPFTRQQLGLSGLFTDDLRRFLFPENRLCIPWRDPLGRIATLQRRRLGSGGDAARKYVFPSGPLRRHPYGVERLRAHVPVVWCEGAVDVLARRELDRRAGIVRDVLGVPGVGNWKTEWATLARNREALVATDADEPGDLAAKKWAVELYEAGALSVGRLRPKAHDWADDLAAATRRSVA